MSDYRTEGRVNEEQFQYETEDIKNVFVGEKNEVVTKSGSDPFDFAQGRLRNIILRPFRAGKQAHLCKTHDQ